MTISTILNVTIGFRGEDQSEISAQFENQASDVCRRSTMYEKAAFC